jgi:hypothetical protein
MVGHSAEAGAGWRQGMLESIFTHQPAAPIDVMFGTAHHNWRYRPLRPIDKMPIERLRQSVPKAFPFCCGTCNCGRLADRNGTHRGLSYCSISSAECALDAV